MLPIAYLQHRKRQIVVLKWGYSDEHGNFPRPVNYLLSNINRNYYYHHHHHYYYKRQERIDLTLSYLVLLSLQFRN